MVKVEILKAFVDQIESDQQIPNSIVNEIKQLLESGEDWTAERIYSLIVGEYVNDSED